MIQNGGSDVLENALNRIELKNMQIMKASSSQDLILMCGNKRHV